MGTPLPFAIRKHKAAKIFRLGMLWDRARIAIVGEQKKHFRMTEAEHIAAQLYVLAHMDYYTNNITEF